MTYIGELNKAMRMLAEHPKTIFMGQAVAYPGTAMYGTLEGVPMEKRLELPVAEDMQMGMAIGMALDEYLPVCIYPRFNFLLLAINQLVLHLDKIPVYSRGGYKPKVIIRTAIASDDPMDPGPQHLGDYTMQISSMLKTVHTFKLMKRSWIIDDYKMALEAEGSSLLIEMAALYQS